MSAFTLTPDPDPDPTDRSRACGLASAGLPGYCATIAINARGEECYLLAAYGTGEADYLTDWARTAPHEVIDGLPVYWKGGLNWHHPRPSR